jgi:CubicO group peptidase (beta-lactamase class C family)
MIANGGELNGKRILTEAAVKQMVTLSTGDMKAGHSAGVGWTLGWGIVREPTGLTAALSLGSFGHGGAFGTIGWIDPSRNAVLVLMVARSDMNAAMEAEIRGEMVKAGVKELSVRTKTGT